MLRRRPGEGDRSVRRDRGVDPEREGRIDIAEVEATDRTAVSGNDPIRCGRTIVTAGEKRLSTRHPDRAEEIVIERAGNFFSIAAACRRDPDCILILTNAALRMPVGNPASVGRANGLALVDIVRGLAL